MFRVVWGCCGFGTIYVVLGLLAERRRFRFSVFFELVRMLVLVWGILGL